MDKEVLQIIDTSAWPVEIKTELKQLVQKFAAFVAEEADALDDMHKSKAGCNEKQYSKRLKEPLSTEKRDEVLSNQFAYRNWFANAVMRIHEARRQLIALAAIINARVTELAPQAGEGKTLVLVALTRMVRDQDLKAADCILGELDNVSELSRKRIFDAVRAIFKGKRENTGIFAKQNFTSSPLMLVDPTATQEEMDEAVVPAIAIRWHFEALWDEFTSAKSKYNVRQFNERMEQCIQAGAEDKLTQVRGEMANAEARLFVAATRYAEAHDELNRISDRLHKAIRANVETIQDTDSVEAIKAMCHCLGIWHWLGELTGYIEGKFRSCNPAAVLADLDFNPGAYIKA